MTYFRLGKQSRSEEIAAEYAEMMRMKKRDGLTARLAHAVCVANSNQMVFGRRYSQINNGDSFFTLPDIVKGRERVGLKTRIRFETLYA